MGRGGGKFCVREGWVGREGKGREGKGREGKGREGRWRWKFRQVSEGGLADNGVVYVYVYVYVYGGNKGLTECAREFRGRFGVTTVVWVRMWERFGARYVIERNIMWVFSCVKLSSQVMVFGPPGSICFSQNHRVLSCTPRPWASHSTPTRDGEKSFPFPSLFHLCTCVRPLCRYPERRHDAQP